MYRINNVLLLCTILSSGAADADPYLDALEAESSRSSIDSATLPQSKSESAIAANTSMIPPRMRENKFSTFLMNNYYETFVQLNAMEFLDRQNIYLQYLEMDAPDIDDINTQIAKIKH